ncbi:MAG: hypothetical protein SPI97_08330 [Oscillospiraceae bacterium]|nr:hypothetical protein [Oscillospiraceae bacterium]
MFGDKGFFGGLFDFNGDGKLDSFERAADFAAFAELMDEAERNEAADDDEELDSDDSDF